MHMELKTKEYKPFTEDEISIRRDEIFKIVFGSNDRSEYLKAFLESILHEKITNIVIKNEVLLDKIHKDNKQMKLDILAEINGKEKINIEMQNKNDYNIVYRSYGYSSGIYYDALREAEDYRQYKKTVVIWILGYNLKDSKKYHDTARTRLDSNNAVFGDNIVYHFIQLPKFIEQIKEINTQEEQWLAYLSCSLSEEEKGELYKMNRSIEEVNKIVDIVMKDKDVQEELRYRVLDKQLEQLKEMRAYENGEEHGKEIGKEIGKQEGEKENREKIVKQMIELKVDEDIIIKSTGITKEELEDIKKNYK